MLPQTALRTHLSEKPAGVFWLSLGSVGLAEIVAGQRPDAVVFDLQHGLWSPEVLHHAIGLVSGQTVPLVRVETCTYEAIGRALDAGAAGVIVPMVESGSMALNAVQSACYPPDGHRSMGGIRPLMEAGRWVQTHSESPPFVAVMIETMRGVEAADEILSVRGIDMVFLGTGDLTISAMAEGKADNLDALFTKLIRTVKKAGVFAGLFHADFARISDWLGAGADMVVLAADNLLVQGGIEKSLASWSRLLEQTDA